MKVDRWEKVDQESLKTKEAIITTLSYQLSDLNKMDIRHYFGVVQRVEAILKERQRKMKGK